MHKKGLPLLFCMQPVVCTFAASAYSSPYVLTHVIRGLHTVRVSYNVVFSRELVDSLCGDETDTPHCNLFLYVT